MVTIPVAFLLLLSNTHECFRHNFRRFSCHERHLSSESVADELTRSIDFVTSFNNNFTERVSDGRKIGLSVINIEFRRVQELGADGVRKEREEIRKSVSVISKNSKQIVLGITAESGDRAILTLRNWIQALELPRGVLRIYDDDGIETNATYSFPVYLKYNSSDHGDAYMKPYKGVNRGVVFQPLLYYDDNGDFRQYGDFPLATFPSV